MGFSFDSLDEGDGYRVSKIAFCFPGQGSIEAGMGYDIAQAVPQAMDVFEMLSRTPALLARVVAQVPDALLRVRSGPFARCPS